MMKRKKKIKLWEKIYIVWEPTVFLYELSFDDVEQFLEELFLEFNDDIPELNSDQITKIIKDLFEIDDDKDFISKKTKNKETWLKDFHIIIGQFMKFYSNSYEQVIGMPFRIFKKLLDDRKIISWDEKYDKNRFNESPEKSKLKKLYNNQ